MKRNLAFALVACVVAVVFVPNVAANGSQDPGATNSAAVQGDWGKIDWRQFKGTKLNVLMTSMPVAEVYKKAIPQFEALTGITVNLELLNDTDRRNKQIIDFSGGIGEYDVSNIGYSNREEFAVPGYLEDLGPYLENPKLTDKAWYNFGDYPKGIIASGYSNDKLVMIPFTGEYFLLWYRKDIFQKLNLKPPATMDDLVATAEKLDQARKAGKITEYAWVDRQKPGSGEAGWNLFCTAYRFNFEFVNFKTKTSYVNTEDGRKVLSFYTSLVKRFAPPGSGNWTWPEIADAFKTKKVAMTVAGNASYAFLEDAKQSQVAGMVGYAPPPMASGGHDPLWVWGWGVNAKSRSKNAAWLFVQWATSPTVMKTLAPQYGVPARESSYSDPDYIKAMPSEEFVKAQQFMLTKGIIAQHGLIDANYGQVADLVSIGMSTIIADMSTVEQAAKITDDQLLQAGYKPAK